MKLNFQKIELEILSPWLQTVKIFFVPISFRLNSFPDDITGLVQDSIPELRIFAHKSVHGSEFHVLGFGLICIRLMNSIHNFEYIVFDFSFQPRKSCTNTFLYDLNYFGDVCGFTYYPIHKFSLKLL
jgi:hypothetical protein